MKMINMMGKQVKTVARIVEGDTGKVICKEAERTKPAAVVMGTRGRSLFQRCVCVCVSFIHSLILMHALLFICMLFVVQCVTRKCW